jgi:hypothetical protein
MTNFIEEARSELVDLLSDWKVYPFRPEGATPPCIFIEPRDPYLEPGTAYRDWRMSVSLTYVGQTATNKKATEDLDQVISEVIEAVRENWSVDSVSAGLLDVNESTYVSAAINIHTQLSI